MIDCLVKYDALSLPRENAVAPSAEDLLEHVAVAAQRYADRMTKRRVRALGYTGDEADIAAAIELHQPYRDAIVEEVMRKAALHLLDYFGLLALLKEDDDIERDPDVKTCMLVTNDTSVLGLFAAKLKVYATKFRSSLHKAAQRCQKRAPTRLVTDAYSASSSVLLARLTNARIRQIADLQNLEDGVDENVLSPDRACNCGDSACCESRCIACLTHYAIIRKRLLNCEPSVVMTRFSNRKKPDDTANADRREKRLYTDVMREAYILMGLQMRRINVPSGDIDSRRVTVYAAFGDNGGFEIFNALHSDLMRQYNGEIEARWGLASQPKRVDIPQVRSSAPPNKESNGARRLVSHPLVATGTRRRRRARRYAVKKGGAWR